MELRIAYLYPDVMNIYGDRGNVAVLSWRCRWRDVNPIITHVGLGETFDPRSCDFLFVGGGQDRDQQLMASDFEEVKGESLRVAAASGCVVLAVCGGYQLLGQYYRAADGSELRGLGILDAWTVHPGGAVPRSVGNVVIQCEWDARRPTLVGFENHGGRTYLGPQAKPLGRVLKGYGNNARDGTEGAVQGSVYGTYLHGSLLPKNPWFADALIGQALRRRYGDGAVSQLRPLDDALEVSAHDAMVARLTR